MKNLLTIILVFIAASNLLSQENENRIEMFPAGINFQPLNANFQEARVGVLIFSGTNNLKVDIGNNIDLVKYNIPDENIAIAAGLEFMAYAYSTSYKEKRLQIDAIDGFFGGNLTLNKKIKDNALMLRFRFIHNSAHLVDGSYDVETGKWIEREPYPFTKNFSELTAAHKISDGSISVKYFGGLSYATLIRPKNLKKLSYHAGFEFYVTNLLGKIYGLDENLFLANYFSLAGLDKYFGSHQIMAGMKIGQWESKGITLYISYYTGQDIFNAYFDRKISKLGAGFFVDFL